MFVAIFISSLSFYAEWASKHCWRTQFRFWKRNVCFRQHDGFPFLFHNDCRLCEFIEHYHHESQIPAILQTNLFERYPCIVLYSESFNWIGNITNEYKKAKILFSNHSFSKAAETIERVNHFDENLSFLFLWGYSKYMVFTFLLILFITSSPSKKNQ